MKSLSDTILLLGVIQLGSTEITIWGTSLLLTRLHRFQHGLKIAKLLLLVKALGERSIASKFQNLSQIFSEKIDKRIPPKNNAAQSFFIREIWKSR